MGIFDSIFGDDKPAPVPTATPNLKTPVNKSQPVETLTPMIGPPKPALATPVQPEQPVSPWMDKEFRRKLRAHETGVFDGNEVLQLRTLGDKGEALGPFQQHEINVQDANQTLAKQRRIVAQKWAKEHGFSLDSKEYKNYLNGLPPSVVYTAKDRSDPKKSIEIYNVNMSALVPLLEKAKGGPLTEIELARAHNAGNVKRYQSNQNYGTRYTKSMGLLSEADKKKAEEEKKKAKK
jgi:hypothetical protein